MSTISALNNNSSAATSQQSSSGLEDVNVDQFLKLMIAELQNQDPMDPMENSEMMQQLGQMRSISATDKLTKTLDAVLVGQNLTTASSMIGKEVNALTDDGTNVKGMVDRVSVTPANDGNASAVRIHIGEDSIALKNVREILPLTTP